MSRIDGQRYSQLPEQPKRTAHPDYPQNLKHSEILCENVKKNLLNGMNVKIADSEHLKKALLIISWCPGMHVKRGNYATPIFLHQYNADFKKTAENVLNFYLKTVTEHEKINPKQPEFLPPNMKI